MEHLLPTLLCLLAGAALIVVECLTPGVGAAGIFGIVSLAVAVVLQIHNVTGMLFVLAVAVLVVAAAVLVMFELGSRGKLFRSKLGLKERIEGEASPARELPDGAIGVAVTELRPVGAAQFDGKRYEVQTNGVFLAKNTPVRVCGTTGMRLLVEEWKQEENC